MNNTMQLPITHEDAIRIADAIDYYIDRVTWATSDTERDEYKRLALQMRGAVDVDVLSKAAFAPAPQRWVNRGQSSSQSTTPTEAVISVGRVITCVLFAILNIGRDFRSTVITVISPSNTADVHTRRVELSLV